MYSSVVMSEPDRGVKGFCSGTAPINVSRDHVSICNLPPLYVGVSQKYWHDLLWMQCDQSFPWKQSYAHFINRLGVEAFLWLNLSSSAMKNGLVQSYATGWGRVVWLTLDIKGRPRWQKSTLCMLLSALNRKPRREDAIYLHLLRNRIHCHKSWTK